MENMDKRQLHTSRGKKLCALAIASQQVQFEENQKNSDINKHHGAVEEITPANPTTSTDLSNFDRDGLCTPNVTIEINDPELKSLIESQGIEHVLNIENGSGNYIELYEEEVLDSSISNRTENKKDIFTGFVIETGEIQDDTWDSLSETEDNVNESILTRENDFTTETEAFSNQELQGLGPLHVSEHEPAREEDPILSDGEVGGRPKKGRKRKFQDQTRTIKKLRVNTNQDYIDTKGNLKMSKEFREYICNCRMKCHVRIPVDTCNVIFQNFHKAGTLEGRYQIIQGLVKETPIKRKRAKGSNIKTTSREYYLADKVVCKAMFLQTLRVSSCVIDRALKLKRSNAVVCDGRGKSGGHTKTSEEKVKRVMRHIAKFPRYISHYCRTKTDAKYLNSNVTIPVMYDLFIKENPDHIVSKEMYKKIFLRKFNLRRKPSKKDTCVSCDKSFTKMKHLQGNDLEEEKVKHEAHVNLAEQARNLMKQDFLNASDDTTKECLSFDLEKTLPLPRIPTNIVYYKRQLCFYNCGIHDSKSKGYCYTWVEGTAGRGSQEVSSCLRKHILTKIPPETTRLDLWSDSCGGQNRNIKIVLMLKAILESHPGLEVITQKFLIPGHTFLKNDSDFSDIESALKLHERLYVADDYIHVIQKCRKKNPLIVTKMEPEDFFGTGRLESAITNRKVSVGRMKINWLQFRVVEVRKKNPMSIFVKEEFSQEKFREIDILKKKGRKSASNESNDFFTSKLEELWPNGKPVSEAKLADLKSMFGLIPKDCLAFYKKLTATPNIEDDIEGFGGDLDFDVDLE